MGEARSCCTLEPVPSHLLPVELTSNLLPHRRACCIWLCNLDDEATLQAGIALWNRWLTFDVRGGLRLGARRPLDGGVRCQRGTIRGPLGFGYLARRPGLSTDPERSLGLLQLRLVFGCFSSARRSRLCL